MVPSANLKLYAPAVVAAAIAAFLFVAVVLFAPRPDIRMSNLAFEAGSCDMGLGQSTVTATFRLTNHGTADGVVIVRVFVDGSRRVDQAFLVLSGASTEGRIAVVLGDCLHHRFWADTCYPGTEGAC